MLYKQRNGRFNDVTCEKGIETDFLYEKDGEHGLWLEIVEVMEDGRKES